MATLYLHAGHGKTGTSYIQSCFRLNRLALASKGIDYAHGQDYNVKSPNSITSGNAYDLFASESSFYSNLEKNRATFDKALLFSSENILHSFVDSNGEKYLEAISEKFGFNKIKILLFIRNPINRAVSVWQQSIKRHGNFKYNLSNLNAYLENRTDILYYVEEFVNRLYNYPDINLTIRNYNNCSNRLIAEVADWLDVPESTFEILPNSFVNRSLAYSELIFQMSLNRILGDTGSIFADPLCEKIPELKPDNILPPIEVQKKIWFSQKEVIKELNKKIPEKERYQCDIQEPEPVSEILSFNRKQIETISGGLGGEILRLRNELKEANKRISELTGNIIELRSNKKPVKVYENGVSAFNRLKKRIKSFF